MKRYNLLAITLTLLVLVGASGGCLQEKVLDIILNSESYADFVQNSTSVNWTNTATIDVGQELDDALNDNGYARSDIEGATVMGASYGVTSFTQAHDWMIAGEVRVERLDKTDGPVVLLDYSTQSIADALGQKIPAALTTGGVSVVQRAIDDWLNGENPVLRFTVENGTVSPTPSQVDPIQFDWRAWLAVQLNIPQTVEVPDPF